MFKSLNSRIIISITGIIVVVISTLMYFVRIQSDQSFKSIHAKNAKAFLNAITTTVENEFYSIEFHRKKALEWRKQELTNLVGLAYTVLSREQKKAAAGLKTEEEAKKQAANTIRNLRYDNGIGYFWINDTTRPVPYMIMHPTRPELDGTILDNTEFNCANNRGDNLFVSFNDVCSEKDHGYVDYLWPKPTPDGLLSPIQPKLSYVKLFKPWNWIIGSGLYIDDIEKERNERVKAVINELRRSFMKLDIGESSYMFVFTSKMKMPIHPWLESEQINTLYNPNTGNNLLEEIMTAAKSGKNYIDYRWKKPGKSSNQLFWKRAYVRYFKPLDWYICVTFYKDEVEAPARAIELNILRLSILFLMGALILALLLSKSLTTPLKKLSVAAESLDITGIEEAIIPISGSSETRELGRVLNKALKTISEKEKAIRSNEENLRITLESIGDGVIVTDVRGMVQKMNYIAQSLLDWPLEKAQGKFLFNKIELIDIISNKQITDIVEDALKIEYNKRITKKCRLINGSAEELIVSCSYSPVRTAHNKTLGIVFAFHDITEQTRIEEQLHQSRKMDSLGQLAGGVAHDFNNMLAGIVGAAEILHIELSEQNSDKQKYTEVIIETVEKAASLTEKLLAFSHKGKIHSTPVNVNHSIRDALTMLEHSIDRRITITTDLRAAMHIVQGDPSQLQNMIINLGINAGHAMPEGGELNVTTENVQLDEIYCHNSDFNLSPGTYLQISIRDTGFGIEPDILSKVFEPFFTTKEVGQGTGLGLAAVYGTVKDHKGAVTVYSEVGRGTVFHIFLPIDKSINCVPDQTSKNFTKGSGTILVIDDEPIIRLTAKKLLESLGYKIMTAENGVEGLKIYSNEYKNIDLVLLDMIMPRMNGRDTFKAIKKCNPHAKVVIASGFTHDNVIDDLIKSGLMGFVKKPYTRHEISEIISSILNRDS